METAMVSVAVIGYLAFRQWLQFNRRRMIHRERLVSIERGVDLPPLVQEVRRSGWNVQQVLLLAGLVWVSLGLWAFLALILPLAPPSPLTPRIPPPPQSKTLHPLHNA